VPDAKLWSPDRPFLYDLRVTLKQNGNKTDEVRSYFACADCTGKDSEGILRLCLNNKPLFQLGPLDRASGGCIYTAPTDEALRYDIEMTRKLGFNMARKHVKIEPDRWYYWRQTRFACLAGHAKRDKYIGGRDPTSRVARISRQFERELKALVEGRFNHPALSCGSLQRGLGQWDTCRIVDLVKSWDPTRLVNNASGWTDRKCGDVLDIHSYPAPLCHAFEEKRALVLGESRAWFAPQRPYLAGREKLGLPQLHQFRRTHRRVRRPNQETPPHDRPARPKRRSLHTDHRRRSRGQWLMTTTALVKMDQSTITAANLSVYSPPQQRRNESARLAPPPPACCVRPYFSVWSPATSSPTRHRALDRPAASAHKPG